MEVTFDRLNTDVQLEILEVLHSSSRRSLLNVSKCSKSLRGVSRSLIYRVIPILFTRKRRETNGRLLQLLLADHDLSAKVREIRILWAPSANLQRGEGSKDDLELLGRALPRLTGLKTFVWDAQYPPIQWLIDALYTNAPHCWLYIRAPARRDPVRTLSMLRDSPCLYSLDVTFSPGDMYAFSRLREIVSSSKELKDLEVVWDGEDHAMTWWQSLQSLPTPLQLRSLELDGPMNLIACEESWKWSVAWPQLERFSCTNISFLQNLATQLTGLNSLRLRVSQDEDKDGLWTFLSKHCHQLKILDLTGCTAYINRLSTHLWEHLGRTLISLRIHEDEMPSAFRERPTLSSSQLEHLAKTCHKLRSLGLDLECSYRPLSSYQLNRLDSEKVARGYQMLDQVADMFWFLEHLEVNLEINIGGQGEFTNTRATLEGAEEMWNYLWVQMKSSRTRKSHEVTVPRLRSFDVVGGSYRPVSEISHWEAAAQQRFHIDLSHRHEEARRGTATVTCVELKALQRKLGYCEPFGNHQQKVLMDAVRERADTGPFVRQLMDREMTRASSFWDRFDDRRFYYR